MNDAPFTHPKTMLPKELTLIEEDIGGTYFSSTDCWIARALKRAGIFIDDENGYSVSSGGEIIHAAGDYPTVGVYKWKNVELFGFGTKRTGKLVLHAD